MSQRPQALRAWKKKKICSRFVRTRNRNVPVPSTDKAPATRYQMAHYGTGPDRMDRQAVSLVAGQYCMSRTVSVIGSFSRRQARHVAHCTLHVARYSSLAASGAGRAASQPVSQPTHRVQGLQAQNTLRTRCSYMCSITWTIVVLVVLMSNSNNRPVARTTFSQPAWLSAARTLRWNLEGPATAHSQGQQSRRSLVATPVQRSEDAKLLCPATVPSRSWAMWYAVRSIIAPCAAQYTTLHYQQMHIATPLLPPPSCTEARVRKPSRCMT